MKIKSLMIAALCCACAGCSPFKASKEPPPVIYALHAAPVAAVQPARKAHVVVIPEPQVPAGFDSPRIGVYLDGGRRFDYAAGAAWPSPLPAMLQQLLLESAQAQPGVLAVAPEAGINARHRLVVRVNECAPVYAGDAVAGPELRISLTFSLVPMRTEEPVASFTLAEKRQVGNSLGDITAGMEEMLRAMTAEGWTRLKRAL